MFPWIKGQKIPSKKIQSDIIPSYIVQKNGLEHHFPSKSYGQVGVSIGHSHGSRGMSQVAITSASCLHRGKKKHRPRAQRPDIERGAVGKATKICHGYALKIPKTNLKIQFS